MSLKSYFRKKHKYETQSDLKDMTAEQIISLSPSDVGSYIETETGGIPLTGVKKRAMFNLLSQKQQEKKTGPNPRAREKIIDSFLKREGLRNDPEVTKMIVDTGYEITENQVTMKSLENRLKKLRGDPEVPYTDEEELFIRMKNLKIGGRTRRHRREKSKRRKSHKKSRTHKKGRTHRRK